MDTGRSHDIRELMKERSRTSDPVLRRNLDKSIFFIKNESGAIRSMREKLVRAHRNGDREEIKDIHDWVSSHKNYKNE